MPKRNDTTEAVEVASSDTDQLPAELPKGDALMQRIMKKRDTEEASGEDIAESIILRYLTAATAEDVLAPQKAVAANTIIGQAFQLHAVRFNDSTVDGGDDFYAVMESVLGGRPTAITCGSRNVMAQAMRLEELGVLPLWVCVQKLPTKTQAGFQPLYLEAVTPDAQGNVDADEEQF